MGRDNHPRQRRASQLQRKKPQRPAYDRILIVTEGEKTEVNYFEEIRRFHRLSSAHIRVCNSPYGTTPLQVVEYARDRCRETLEWERVFCVIDRDDHQRYVEALNSAQTLDGKYPNDLGQPIVFSAIPSNPCFELWFLLHFQAHEAHIHRTDVFRLLRDRYLQGYEKGRHGIFEATMQHLDRAYANAERLRAHGQGRGLTNPSTCVDELVRILCALRSY
ncbi:RloB family protein [Paraburkholderia tuberum]|uniref:RloB-like protein n=1 Tax=Paraburkholderia tuberum TaxID=157910 RepID=A0A1H1G4I2_9BURK|nr:RloB family protein [Paraburkholderia tuberum]SDR08157.1 RloB-like protein [Paraburkholderia tuberum]